MPQACRSEAPSAGQRIRLFAKSVKALPYVHGLEPRVLVELLDHGTREFGHPAVESRTATHSRILGYGSRGGHDTDVGLSSRRQVALGGGVIVPYPEPGSAAATNIGRGNQRRDTKPEVRLHSALHRRGLRFRKDHLLRCGKARVRADVVFTRALVAVFVDGCFWHGCPEHQRIPQRNIDYWAPKLQANIARDRRVDAALIFAGWHVERLWEHEDPEDAAARTEAVVRTRLPHVDQTRRS